MNSSQRVIMIWCNCQRVTCNKSSLFALKLKELKKQGKINIYFVIIFIYNIPHFHCMHWIELNWISLVELHSIPHWIKIQFEWIQIQLKRNGMQIGGKSYWKFASESGVGIFFKELKI
jgi:hypothetical protein